MFNGGLPLSIKILGIGILHPYVTMGENVLKGLPLSIKLSVIGKLQVLQI